MDLHTFNFTEELEGVHQDQVMLKGTDTTPKKNRLIKLWIKTWEDKVRAAMVAKNWEQISKKTIKRLHIPWDPRNAPVELDHWWLLSLYIPPVIVYCNSVCGKANSLAHSIHHHHPKYKAHIELPAQEKVAHFWFRNS